MCSGSSWCSSCPSVEGGMNRYTGVALFGVAFGRAAAAPGAGPAARCGAHATQQATSNHALTRDTKPTLRARASDASAIAFAARHWQAMLSIQYGGSPAVVGAVVASQW
jgi:hypothetical protein